MYSSPAAEEDTEVGFTRRDQLSRGETIRVDVDSYLTTRDVNQQPRISRSNRQNKRRRRSVGDFDGSEGVDGNILDDDYLTDDDYVSLAKSTIPNIPVDVSLSKRSSLTKKKEDNFILRSELAELSNSAPIPHTNSTTEAVGITPSTTGSTSSLLSTNNLKESDFLVKTIPTNITADVKHGERDGLLLNDIEESTNLKGSGSTSKNLSEQIFVGGDMAESYHSPKSSTMSNNNLKVPKQNLTAHQRQGSRAKALKDITADRIPALEESVLKEEANGAGEGDNENTASLFEENLQEGMSRSNNFTEQLLVGGDMSQKFVPPNNVSTNQDFASLRPGASASSNRIGSNASVAQPTLNNSLRTDSIFEENLQEGMPKSNNLTQQLLSGGDMSQKFVSSKNLSSNQDVPSLWPGVSAASNLIGNISVFSPVANSNKSLMHENTTSTFEENLQEGMPISNNFTEQLLVGGDMSQKFVPSKNVSINENTDAYLQSGVQNKATHNDLFSSPSVISNLSSTELSNLSVPLVNNTHTLHPGVSVPSNYSIAHVNTSTHTPLTNTTNKKIEESSLHDNGEFDGAESVAHAHAPRIQNNNTQMKQLFGGGPEILMLPRKNSNVWKEAKNSTQDATEKSKNVTNGNPIGNALVALPSNSTIAGFTGIPSEDGFIVNASRNATSTETSLTNSLSSLPPLSAQNIGHNDTTRDAFLVDENNATLKQGADVQSNSNSNFKETVSRTPLESSLVNISSGKDHSTNNQVSSSSYVSRSDLLSSNHTKRGFITRYGKIHQNVHIHHHHHHHHHHGANYKRTKVTKATNKYKNNGNSTVTLPKMNKADIAKEVDKLIIEESAKKKKSKVGLTKLEAVLGRTKITSHSANAKVKTIKPFNAKNSSAKPSLVVSKKKYSQKSTSISTKKQQTGIASGESTSPLQ